MGTNSDDIRDNVLSPEDVESAPAAASSARDRMDPNDEVPVPVAMSPAEIDERAQVVDALRKKTAGKKRNEDDTLNT